MKNYYLYFILISLGGLLISRNIQNQLLCYVFKPLTILLIFTLPFTYLEWSQFPVYSKFIIAGLFFSILGDIFLMFDKYFKLGMVSFLITHILYIQAILGEHGFQLSWVSIIFVAGWFYFGKSTMPLISATLKIPVLVYSLVLTFLVWQSVELFMEFPTHSTKLFIWGIVMFASSDWILIVNKYQLNWLEPLKLPLYFLGQMLIAFSIIHYG